MQPAPDRASVLVEGEHMTVRRWMVPIAILAIAGAALAAGCGDDDDSADAGDTSAPVTADVAYAQSQIDAFRAEPEFTAPGPPVDAAAAAGKSVALIPASSNVPFVTTIANNMVSIGRDVGLEVSVFKNNGSPAEWTQGVTDAIAKQADSIDLLAGLDPSAISAPVRQATGQGISVVATHLYDVNQ